MRGKAQRSQVAKAALAVSEAAEWPRFLSDQRPLRDHRPTSTQLIGSQVGCPDALTRFLKELPVGSCLICRTDRSHQQRGRASCRPAQPGSYLRGKQVGEVNYVLASGSAENHLPYAGLPTPRSHPSQNAHSPSLFPLSTLPTLPNPPTSPPALHPLEENARHI